MLKHRLLTALIVTPIFILAILFLPPIWFALFTGLLVLGCAWEWAFVAGVKSTKARLSFVAVLFLVIAGVMIFLFPFLFMLFTVISVYVAAILWVLAFFVVMSYARKDFKLEYTFVKLVAGFFFLLAFWFSLNLLQGKGELGFNTLLMVFILIWSVDVGAYAMGRLCGKHKLIQRVSPNKTWEGLVGGVVLSVVVAFIFGFCLNWSWQLMLAFGGVALVTALFAVLGDLFESMLKRQVNVKDSGNILPGHGGLLDRFDSAIAALPIFLLGMVVLGY